MREHPQITVSRNLDFPKGGVLQKKQELMDPFFNVVGGSCSNDFP